MDRSLLLNKFIEKFDSPPEQVFFAPGRINLIGEHTDYNGGHVFPCSITLGTYALVVKRDDNKFRLYSENFPEIGIIEFDPTDLEYKKDHYWANYPKGMIKFLMEKGLKVSHGLDILFYGNISNGAGLSSSASIELVTGVMLEKMYHFPIDRVELVKIGQRVENQYIGVNSGIMDQFAIGMGKENSGILLDCNTLEYEYAPLHLDHYKIVIMNTNKRRELADSKYNERRSECEAALRDLQQVIDIQSLGDLSVEKFQQLVNSISNETNRKRAKHAVYENERTIEALKALKANDLTRFGQLINESHISLRDDYEVTGMELDTIVEAAWQQEGVLGARMTGAGFGGCAIAIVESDRIQSAIEKIGEIYKERTGLDAEFYIVQVGDGAKQLNFDEFKL